jgi:hypothetical protein
MTDRPDLVAFSDWLHLAGLRPSMHQVLAAGELLSQLQRRDAMPRDADGLAACLGPIFCTSYAEQREFPQHLRHWLATSGWSPASADGPAAAVTSRRARLPWIGRVPFSYLLVIIGLLFALLTASAAWQHLHERELTGRVIDEQGEPVPGAIVQMLGQTATTRELRDDPGGRGAGHFEFRVRAKDLPARMMVWKSGFVTEDTTMAGPEIEERRRSLYLRGWGQELAPLVIVLMAADPGPPGEGVPVTSPTLPAMKVTVQPVENVSLGDIVSTATLSERVVWPAAGLVLVPSLVLAMLWGVRWMRVPVLERRTGSTPRTLREVKLQRGLSSLIPGLPLRRLAQELRRRRLVSSTELQVESTIHATLRKAGVFTPVLGSRVEPDYLVLIDTASVSDHQARLAEELVAELQRADVMVERFAFDHDATMCRPRGRHHAIYTRQSGPATRPLRETQPVSLEELQARWPDHRVFIFGDAAELFDAFSGAPAAWLSTALKWEETTIFTAGPVEQWRAPERALQRLGFRVLPFNRSGVLALISSASGGSPEGPAAHSGESRHSFAEAGLRRWVEREPPPARTISSICEELAKDLGPRGFAWLAACAAYPEIHWGITLRLGAALVPDALEMERLLPRLSRLIWFRDGYMPDWLRLALLDRLEPADYHTARSLLLEMLERAVVGPTQDIPLRIAIEPALEERRADTAADDGFAPRLRAISRRWMRRLRFTRLQRTASEHSPLRDHVFLLFAEGGRIGKLRLPVGQHFLSLLFREGSPLLGMRAGVQVIGVVVATVALGLMMSPIRMQNPRAETFDLQWSAQGDTLAVPTSSLYGSPAQGIRSVERVMVRTGSRTFDERMLQSEVAAADIPDPPPVVLSPDLKRAATFGDGAWTIRDVATGMQLTKAPAARDCGASACAQFAGNGSGSTLVFAQDDQLAYWDIESSRIVRSLRMSDVAQLAVSRNGQHFAAVSSDRRNIMVWSDAEADVSVKNLISSRRLRHLAITSNGETLIGTDASNVYLWDLTVAQPSRFSSWMRFSERGISGLALDDTDRLLAVAQGFTGVQLFDLAYRQTVASLGASDQQDYRGAAFDSSATILATRTAEGQIGLWKLGVTLEPLPPRPPVRPSLDGYWTGQYSYDDSRPSVRIEVTLKSQGTQLTGTMQEPSTFQQSNADNLSAEIKGTAVGNTVQFAKIYDGKGNVSHSVRYVGDLDRSGMVMTGKWYLEDGSGTFVLRKSK